jgi:hypothetical protein
MNTPRWLLPTCIAESSTRNHAISGATSAEGWYLPRKVCRRWLPSGAVLTAPKAQ